jgi:putative membrane protein insertion efficiency factor
MQFAANITKRITLPLLQAYKSAISSLLPHACRYVPTCSEYAMEAVERYGTLRGMWMAIGRLLRCHPFGGSGYDPVVQSSMPRSMPQPANAKYFHPSGHCAPRN